MARRISGSFNQIGSATHQRQIHSLEEHSPTPYKASSKPVEMTMCPECRVVFKNGRWQALAEVQESEHRELCPACKRMRDHIPAGILTLNGKFFSEHRDEIMHLVDHKVREQ
jgi:NMD protein affecting ribosome stability and mRNA decay